MRRHLRVLLAALAVACGSDGTGPTPPPAPVPTQVSVATQPSATVQNGVALNTQPVIRLRDAAGVPAPAAGVVVTATLASGAGVVLANATATTNASGIATFNGLTLTGTVGSYILRFSAPNLTAADANPITVTAGAPSQLALAAQPSAAAQAGVALAAQPAVQLRDASGNDAGVAGVTVNAALVSGTLTLANASAVTSASGVATFSGLTLSGTAGSYTLRFSSGTLAAVTAAQPTVLAAGAPAQLALTTSPAATAANGVPLATQPVVQLRDAFGNDASQAGVRIVASIVTGPAGATIAGDTSLTDAGGRATFGSLAITGLAGNYALRFASTGFTSILSVTPVMITAGAAARLGLSTQPPATAPSGIAMTPPPVVQVQDQSGNPVAQAGVAVTASLAAGTATLTNVTASTDAAGKATFTGLTVTGQVNGYLLQFASPGLTSINASQVLALQAGPAAALSLTTAPSAAATNAAALASQPVVQLRDAQGNAVLTGSVVITASVVSGSVTLANATATTNANGVAAFAGLSLTGDVGSYTLRFSAGLANVSPIDAAAATVLSAGPARRLSLAVQPSSSAVSGAAFGTQPAVQLRDTTGNVVSQAGVVITASVIGGGPTVGNATAATDASGVATFAGLSLSGAPGSYLLRFTTGALVPVDAAAATTLAAGAPSQLVIITLPPAMAVNGVPLTSVPVVEVQDATGNPLGGVTVGAAATGNVTVGNSVAVTGPNGRATYSGLTLTGQVAGYSLRFCLGSNCNTSGVVTGSPHPTLLIAGAPATVTLTTLPSPAAQSGVALARQPVARVADVSGNLLPGVTVTLTTGAGAAIAGGSALTNSVGTATFAGVTVSGPPAAYTLSFAAGTATATAPLTLSAGSAASLTIDVAPPSSSVNGAVFAVAPSVTVRDATGNPVPSVVVDATVLPAGAALINASATTNASGVATFTGLGLAGNVATYSITFTTPGAQATSGTIDLLPGSAASITITQAPSAAAQNNVALATQPVIHLQDATANPIANRLVTATVLSGGAQVSNAVATTNASGDAIFSGLTLTGPLGNQTLRFTSANLSVDAAPVNLGAGVASRLVVVAGGGSQQNGMAFSPAPVIQVADAGGNAVSLGVTVNASIVSGNGVASGVSVATNGAGSATFSALTVTGAAGGYVLAFDAAGLAGVQLGVTVQPGPATRLGLTTQPAGATTLAQPLPVQPVVQLQDQSGNAVSQAGLAVTAGSVSGAVTFNGTTSVMTNASGAAVFTDLGITGPQGRSVLRFASGALAPVTASDTTVAAAPITSNTPIVQSGTLNTQTPFAITVPAGRDSLVVTIAGNGGADLLLRFGAVPNINAGLWDCYPALGGSNETCTMLNPQPGTWYAILLAVFSYSNVTLTATIY